MIIKNGKTISSVMKGSTLIDKIYKGSSLVYEYWTDTFASGVPPLTLLKCKGVDLVDYKLYGNSVQDGTPTPETPIEIESVGDKTKNLYDYISGFVSSANGLTNTLNNDGTIISVGVPNQNYTHIVKTQYINDLLEDGETYTLSQMLYDLPVYVQIIANDINTGTRNFFISHRKPSTFKVDKSTYTYEINVQTADVSSWGSESLTITNCYQLEKGDIATEFEPYGYKIPVKIRNKNICNTNNRTIAPTSAFNPSDYVDLDGEYVFPDFAGNGYKTGNDTEFTMIDGNITWTNSGEWFGIGINLKPKKGVTYTISFDTNDDIITTTGYYSNGYISRHTNSKTILMEEGETDVIVCFRTTTIGTFSISNLQIEEGDISTEYEPYAEPITTNIYLNEPLRKIGDYADYIDSKNSKVIRNIKEFVLNGTEYWGLQSINSYNIANFRTTHIGKIGTDLMISNRFVQQYSLISGTTNEGMHYASDGNTTHFCYLRVNSEKADNVEAFKNWLSQNITKVHVILATSEEETIELPNIPTLKGTTIIEIDTKIQPSNMEVTYKGKGE